MKKAGLIDITDDYGSGKAFPLYIFKVRSGRFEFERAIQYAPEKASAAGTGEIGEFYLSLPVKALNFRILKLPFSETGKLKKVIPFELDNLLLDRHDSYVFDAIVLGDSGNGFEVLVGYKEKEALNEILRGFSILNMEPGIVTSLELGDIVRKGREGIVSRLTASSDPLSLTADARIKAAAHELAGPTINLRTGTAAYARDIEKAKRTVKLTAVLAAALALAINAGLSLGIIKTKNETASVRQEMRSMYSGLFPDEKRITDELYLLKAHLKDIRDKGNAMTGANPLQLLEYLSRTEIKGAVLNELSMDRDSIIMKGEAVSIDDIDRMKTSLAGFIADVSVADIRPSASGKQSFTMIARSKR